MEIEIALGVLVTAAASAAVYIGRKRSRTSGGSQFARIQATGTVLSSPPTESDSPEENIPARSKEHLDIILREQELSKLGPQAVFEDRAKRWAQKLSRMTIPPQIRTWAGKMEELHGRPNVIVGFQVLNWITALLVVRYGEAEDYWPDIFYEDDVQRAREWLNGATPARVRYLPNMLRLEEN